MTLAIRGETSPGEVFAVVGSCEALGSWSHQKAVTLHPVGGDECMWTTTVTVPKGVVTQYRYFKGFFLESKVSRFSLFYCPPHERLIPL